MNFKKLLFYSLWLLLPLLSALAIIKGTYYVGLGSFVLTVNFLLRLFALTALPLIAWQIFLGKFMGPISERFGGWVAQYHFNQGIIIGVLIMIHPVMRLTERYLALSKLDPFYIFTDVCILCGDKQELFVSAGRMGFWLIFVAIMAAKIRKWDWWKENWRYFHWLNYIAFLAIFIHGFNIGSDFQSPIYLPLAIASLGLVIFVVVKRVWEIATTGL